MRAQTYTESQGRASSVAGMVRRVRFLFVSIIVGLVISGCGGGDGDAGVLDGPFLDPEPAALQAAVADAMGAVTSVRFEVERSGSPVFIDQVESIALNQILGTFEVPGSASAILQVTVNDALNTELGAIAIDDEVWLTNPVTGTFETLPPGFDIDPSLFFDPVNGWQPLIEDLRDVTFVGKEDRNGATRYHLTGTASADRMQAITAGLVRGQDVDLAMWVQPVSGQVTELEFSTTFDGAESNWRILLAEYGEDFDISPPDLDG